MAEKSFQFIFSEKTPIFKAIVPKNRIAHSTFFAYLQESARTSPFSFTKIQLLVNLHLKPLQSTQHGINSMRIQAALSNAALDIHIFRLIY